MCTRLSPPMLWDPVKNFQLRHVVAYVDDQDKSIMDIFIECGFQRIQIPCIQRAKRKIVLFGMQNMHDFESIHFSRWYLSSQWSVECARPRVARQDGSGVHECGAGMISYGNGSVSRDTMDRKRLRRTACSARIRAPSGPTSN